MKEFRPAIIRMHKRGVEKREIGRLLGIQATVRKAIKRFITRDEWLPYIPELSPLDYSVLEEKACAKPHPNVESETSFEEGMERNHLGNFDQDRGQLSEATEGLHGCKRRTF